MSDTTVTHEVKVGDSTVHIARFRGLKAIMAGALVARVMNDLPEIQEKVNAFVKDYRKNNYLEITKGMAKAPRFLALGLTADDFEDGPVTIPDEPSWQQIMIRMFPDLWTMARKEVTRFIALIAIPNSELEEADDADNVDEALDRVGKRIIRAGDIDEILEVVVAGWEVLQDQIMAKQARLGKLMDLPFLRALLSTPQSSMTESEQETPEMLENQEELEEEPTEQDEEESTVETPPTSRDEVPTSSTSSEADTAGTEEPLSTVSPGTN